MARVCSWAMVDAMNASAYFSKLVRYLRPYSPLAVGAVATTVCFVATGLLVPWPMKILADSVLGGAPLPAPLQAVLPDGTGKTTLLFIIVGAGFLIALLSGVLNVLATYLKTKLEIAMTLDFRSD